MRTTETSFSNGPAKGRATSHADRLERLAALQATDAGTFVLAVHAFVEGVIRERIEVVRGVEHQFWILVDRYAALRREELGGPSWALRSAPAAAMAAISSGCRVAAAEYMRGVSPSLSWALTLAPDFTRAVISSAIVPNGTVPEELSRDTAICKTRRRG
jgi:hypothetical protein